VEAIIGIQRMLPRVVVMDAALPKMLGFQVCEVVKRNESLRHIHVVLVGATHSRDRSRQTSTELYGADCYIERHELSDQLRSVLGGLGMPVGKVSRRAPPPSVSQPPPVAKAIAPIAQAAGAALSTSASPMQRVDIVSPPEAPPAMVDPKVSDAERLARIMVSDIILYNQKKFDMGVRDGNVLEAMAEGLAEGRSEFDSHVEAGVRGQRDFLAERMVEVARQRGMS
jgi:CheY-like chemotaxis protein